MVSMLPLLPRNSPRRFGYGDYQNQPCTRSQCCQRLYHKDTIVVQNNHNSFRRYWKKWGQSSEFEHGHFCQWHTPYCSSIITSLGYSNWSWSTAFCTYSTKKLARICELLNTYDDCHHSQHEHSLQPQVLWQTLNLAPQSFDTLLRNQVRLKKLCWLLC